MISPLFTVAFLTGCQIADSKAGAHERSMNMAGETERSAPLQAVTIRRLGGDTGGAA
jgi:hypothetical protein